MIKFLAAAMSLEITYRVRVETPASQCGSRCTVSQRGICVQMGMKAVTTSVGRGRGGVFRNTAHTLCTRLQAHRAGASGPVWRPTLRGGCRCTAAVRCPSCASRDKAPSARTRLCLLRRVSAKPGVCVCVRVCVCVMGQGCVCVMGQG